MANTYRPDSNEIEVFKESLEENMNYLSANAAKLDKSARDFVASLCAGYDKYESLTSRQLPYALKYWRELKNLANVSAVSTPPSESQHLAICVDTTEIREMFASAISRLKFPKLLYYTGVGTLVFFVRIHRNPGAIGMRVQGSDNELIGEVLTTGELIWTPGSRLDMRRYAMEVLKAPKEKLALNGKEYKSCCYCGIALTNPASLQAGYGPICADNWGLPWGDSSQHLLETI